MIMVKMNRQSSAESPAPGWIAPASIPSQGVRGALYNAQPRCRPSLYRLSFTSLKWRLVFALLESPLQVMHFHSPVSQSTPLNPMLRDLLVPSVSPTQRI